MKQPFRVLVLAISAVIMMTMVLMAGTVQNPTNPDAHHNLPDTGKTLADLAANSIIDNLPTSGDTVAFLSDPDIYSMGGSGVTDVWGYTAPNGDEYAIVGTYNGISFVNVTDKYVADQVQYTPGCGWRDIKTMGQYCYVVSECSGYRGGIMIIDMSNLPGSVQYIRSVPVDDSYQEWSHNLYIDTVKGFLYAEGNGSGQSVFVHSLADPTNPVFVAQFGPYGVHDFYVRNDTVYIAAATGNAFEIYDASDKQAIKRIARITIPNSGYVHNIWPTDDGRHVVTTEETAYKTIKIWNIEDLENVQLVSEFLGPSGMAHNAQIEGNHIYISHYESGVILADISDPPNAMVLSQYDTWPGEQPTYDGCWGVFPHTASGLVYASNRNGFLYVLKETRTELADTLFVSQVSGFRGTQVKVNIFAQNSLPIYKLIIPVSWDGSYGLVFDSASTVGSRAEYFEDNRLIGYDPGNSRIAYSLRSVQNGIGTPIPPGKGLILSLYFTIPYSASGQTNPVSITAYSSFQATFRNEFVEYAPTPVAGAVKIGPPSCCVGIRGNVDNDPGQEVDIVDLTVMVDYLFGPGVPLDCGEEADYNGDGTEADIVDLVALIDFLFGTGPEAAPCAF